MRYVKWAGPLVSSLRFKTGTVKLSVGEMPLQLLHNDFIIVFNKFHAKIVFIEYFLCLFTTNIKSCQGVPPLTAKKKRNACMCVFVCTEQCSVETLP